MKAGSRITNPTGVRDMSPNVLPASPQSITNDNSLLNDCLTNLDINTDSGQEPKSTFGSPISPSLHERSRSPLASFTRTQQLHPDPIQGVDRTPSPDDLMSVMKTVPSPNPKIHQRQGTVSSFTAAISSVDPISVDGSPTPRTPDLRESASPVEIIPQLQYFHQQLEQPKRLRKAYAKQAKQTALSSPSPLSEGGESRGSFNAAELPRGSSLGVDSGARGRTASNYLSPPSPTDSPSGHSRGPSASKDARPTSYVDLLNVPYHQQIAPAPNLDNSFLKAIVGSNASLLNTKRTLEMYYANVKKTNDPSSQYEFATYLARTARDLPLDPVPRKDSKESQDSEDNERPSRSDLLRKSRLILESLSARQNAFAQYYLADGYASGLFNKDKPDLDKAFTLFLSASKHGHAESSYRTALSYEFGWGSRRDYAKAVQFFRLSASRGHPGAATRLGMACMIGDMGIVDGRKEGLKWLKRAHEMADEQYNVAPYELGLLHAAGSDDVFKDEKYAAQLFTQAAELGNADAALKMGDAYEHGLLTCPRDPGLSLHFYYSAAQAGIPEAMVALCAWYLVGADPFLVADQAESYAWAKRAAEYDYPKALYTLGFFTEKGIGCRSDPLEANVWYVKAADRGDELAKQKLKVIREANNPDPAHQNVTPVKNNKSVLKAKAKAESVASSPVITPAATLSGDQLSSGQNSEPNLAVYDSPIEDPTKGTRKSIFSRLGRA